MNISLFLPNVTNHVEESHTIYTLQQKKSLVIISKQMSAYCKVSFLHSWKKSDISAVFELFISINNSSVWYLHKTCTVWEV